MSFFAVLQWHQFVYENLNSDSTEKRFYILCNVKCEVGKKNSATKIIFSDIISRSSGPEQN